MNLIQLLLVPSAWNLPVLISHTRPRIWIVPGPVWDQSNARGKREWRDTGSKDCGYESGGGEGGGQAGQGQGRGGDADGGARGDGG